MNYSYTDTQLMLHDSAEDFARDHSDFERRRAIFTRPESYSTEDWNLMAELGWLAVLLPEDIGGIAGSSVEAMILMQAIGKSRATEPFFTTAIIGASLLTTFGTPAQQETLTDLAQGLYKTAWAHDEKEAFHNRYFVQTSAIKNTNGFMLNGEKLQVLAGAEADVFFVSARTSGQPTDQTGISLFAIPKNTAGLDLQTFINIDNNPSCHMRLTNVQLPAEALVGSLDEADQVIDHVYRHAIAALTSEALGCMQILHDETLEYLKIRHQFGQAIGKFQALQHKMVDMFTALEEAKSLVYTANMALADNHPSADRLLSMAKIHCSIAGKEVGHAAVQLHGGIGMTEELRVGSLLKRILCIDALFGSSQTHLQRLADQIDT